MPTPAPVRRGRPAPATAARAITVAEVLAALSHALDLTEGQPPGHTVRTCIIGMRIADDLGLKRDQRLALRYALLLKDAGCSSNAARMSALFGRDERMVKSRLKLVDWHHRFRLALQTLRTVATDGSLVDRLRRFLQIARTDGMARELIQTRCERGGEIARALGFSDATVQAIRSLDEHWNGEGYPEGRSGTDIPVLARIANIAQAVEVFHREQGMDGALRVVWERRGRWFDPSLVDVVLCWRKDRAWWNALLADDGIERVAIEDGETPVAVEEAMLDRIAGAFAEIVDAKSPFTHRQSSNVARHAAGIATVLGWSAADRQRITRAALLHDIGKLGVSSRILDKAGSLSENERTEVERHPIYTWQILSRVRPFEGFALTAALHHERLDGSGYPWHVNASALDPIARALAVADIYEAMITTRPYRPGLAPGEALAKLRQDAGTRLCGESVEALASGITAAPHRG